MLLMRWRLRCVISITRSLSNGSSLRSGSKQTLPHEGENMVPHKLTLQFCLFLVLFLFLVPNSAAQQRKAPAGGRLAIVVDERLAALRSTPELNGNLIRRLGRGRLVAIRSAKTNRVGVTFFFVNVSTRTRGWIQRESVVSASRSGDDLRLFRLIEQSDNFDRIVRARIFLDHFRRSPLRPRVLLLLGDTAEALAATLTPRAQLKLNTGSDEAPEFSYFLNYSGLDRYNRQGVHFTFNSSTKRFHYDGHAYRLLLRLHPTSPEAPTARQRLLELAKQCP